MGKAGVIIKRILFWVLLFVYLGMLAFCIVSLATEYKTFGDIKNLVISTITGLFFTLVPVMIRKFLKIEVSLSTVALGYSMLILHTMGEIFDLYYRFQNWDIVLHTFGGYIWAFYTFGAFFSIRPPRGKMQTTIYLLGAMAISVAVSALWEIMEYLADIITGSNMLKVIPENNLFNGGSTNLPLNGTDTEIAEFFRNSSGYMYAVVDTITDLICCVVGDIIFASVYVLVGRRHPLYYQNTYVKIDKVA
jgi:hypothetical protein